MKQYRTALILVVVLLGLGGIAYWEEQKSTKDQAADKDKNKFADFAAVDVEKLVFELRGEKAFNVTIEKVDQKWVLTDPVRFPAEQNTVNSLIQTLADYKYESKIENATDRLAEFGLSPAERSISLTLKGGRVETVNVGKKTPVGYSVYVQKTGDQVVYVGGQQLYMATEKKFDEFRDKTVMDFKETDLVGIELLTKKMDVDFERKSPKDPYTAKKPANFAVDTDAVADFFSSLPSEKAEELIDKPDAKLVAAFAPSKLLASLKWTTAAGVNKTILFTEYDKKTYASYKPTELVYKVGDGVKAKFEKELHAFKDKSIVKMKSEDVVSADIDGNSFVKEKGDWKKKDDKAAKDLQYVQNAVVDLEFAKTDSLPKGLNTAEIMRAAPKHRVKLGFKPELKRSDLTIDVWPADDHVLVKHSDSSQVFYANQSSFSNLSPKTESPDAPSGGQSEMDTDEDLFAPSGE